MLIVMTVAGMAGALAQEMGETGGGKPLVVAHRGYWDAPGAAQNSRRSLAKADSVGAYASEFDVWRSSDGVLFCNHDKKFKGVTFTEATSKVIRNIDLDNGENLPSLYSMLCEARNHPRLRLVFELKEHDDKEAEAQAVVESVRMVDEMGLSDRTDYITFSKEALRGFVNLAPEGSEVYYLTGDLTPAQVKAVGGAGIDYHIGVLRRHPEWVREAHDLGMKVNVWTVDDAVDIRWCVDQGVDLITTNQPVVAAQVIAGEYVFGEADDAATPPKGCQPL